MRTVDRDGVHIEQCTLCRGVFLDAGELEAMVASEARFNTNPASPPPYQAPPGQAPPGQSPPGQDRTRRYPDSPAPYREESRDRGAYRDSPPPYGSHAKHGHRKRSFLDSLFD